MLVEEEKGKFTPKLVKLGRLWLNDLEREAAAEKSLDFQRESLRYHEVIAGLADDDEVLILPSASLYNAQEAFQKRMSGRMGIPGLTSNKK